MSVSDVLGAAGSVREPRTGQARSQLGHGPGLCLSTLPTAKVAAPVVRADAPGPNEGQDAPAYVQGGRAETEQRAWWWEGEGESINYLSLFYSVCREVVSTPGVGVECAFRIFQRRSVGVWT